MSWLLGYVWLPQALLFVTNHRILLRFRRTLLFCIGWSLVFGVAWDLWAINTHTWTFPADTNLGLWFGLPLEEYLFIVFVTLLVASISIILNARIGHRLTSPDRHSRPASVVGFACSAVIMSLLFTVVIAVYINTVFGANFLNFGQYSYLATTLLFAGGAVLIEVLGAYRTVRYYRYIILIIVAFGLLATPLAERVALSEHLWTYAPGRTLQIYVLGAALETYLFMALVCVSISVPALNSMHSEMAERGQRPFQHLYRTFKERLVIVMPLISVAVELPARQRGRSVER